METETARVDLVNALEATGYEATVPQIDEILNTWIPELRQYAEGPNRSAIEIDLTEWLRRDRERKPHGVDALAQARAEEKGYELANAFLSQYPTLNAATAAGLESEWSTALNTKQKFDVGENQVCLLTVQLPCNVR